MAEIIQARVWQKVDTEANWLANPLPLGTGEQAFVSDKNNFKVNTFKTKKTFAELEYYYKGDILGGILPTDDLASKPDGVYRATISGTYRGVVVKEGYYTLLRKTGMVWKLESEVKMPTLSPTGKVEKGNTEAISGGEVYENIKSLDLLVLKQGTGIANYLGVLNKDSVNVTKDLLLTKEGITVTAVNYNITSLLNITQDLDLKIHLYGNNASICFYDSNNLLLKGYNKTDLGNMGLLIGNYLTAKISQITTNVNVKKFRFCFYATDNTIVNEIKLTKDELKNNTLSVLNFNSEQSINSKAVESMSISISDMEDTQVDLINQFNDLKLELEIEKESKQALFIEQSTFTSYWDTPTNPNTVILPTSTNGNIINGNFSPWGSSKITNCAVEYEDGTTDSILISSFTASTASTVKTLTKNVAKISAMFDEINGQHLSDLGYKAMGHHLFNFPKRTAFRSKLRKQINFANHTRVGDTIVDTITNDVVLNYTRLNSLPQPWVGVGASSVSYFGNATPLAYIYGDATLGQGISFDFNSNYTGFVEIYLGTNVINPGSYKIQLIDKKDNSVTKEEIIKGKTKRIILPFKTGDYTIKLTVNEAGSVLYISSISWLEKRELTESIFKSTDRVLFFTDSWGEYPVTTNPEEYTVQFNGQTRPGKCIMPKSFTEKFVASGGKAENVYLCTRGGFTSSWAKHWLNEVISQTNPTKIVFHFGINDSNSRSNYPSTPSVYDFSNTEIFTQQTGGEFGSVNRDEFLNNLIYLKETCINRGITPIFFMLPYTASSTQSQNIMLWNRDVMLPGF